MNQDDIRNGRSIAEIGIAPVRPAEFVIFRIFQRTAKTRHEPSRTFRTVGMAVIRTAHVSAA